MLRKKRLFAMALLTTLAVTSSNLLGADGPTAAALCGFAPHNHVVVLDRGWDIWMAYPAIDPLRPIEFGAGLRSYRAGVSACARLYVISGSGAFSWGDVRVEISGNEIRVNGRGVSFDRNLSVDADGKVFPNAFIRTAD